MTEGAGPPDRPDVVNPLDEIKTLDDVKPLDVVGSPDVAGGRDVAGPDVGGGPEPADPEKLRQADQVALADGFTIATGVEAVISRDGAGTVVIDVPVSVWVTAARHARDTLELDFLDWLSAVDQMDAGGIEVAGLDVVLHVAATNSTGIEGDRARYQRHDFGPPRVRRLMLRTRVPATALVLPSLTSLWPGVAWHERETFEMFGLDFSGFDDGSGLELRPLLLPDGFEGTPLRKSFVLAARAAKAWPGAKDPADSGGKAPSRRKIQPPGVPDPSWGPREPAPRVAETSLPAAGEPTASEPTAGEPTTGESGTSAS